MPSDRASDCSRVFNVPKILMSAPAMNVEPAPIRTIASTSASAHAARDRGLDAFKHAGPERIDRRIVDGENGDAIPDFVTNEVGHGS